MLYCGLTYQPISFYIRNSKKSLQTHHLYFKNYHIYDYQPQQTPEAPVKKKFKSIDSMRRVVCVFERLISLTLKFSNLSFPLRIAFHLPLQPIRCVGRTNLAQRNLQRSPIIENTARNKIRKVCVSAPTRDWSVQFTS